MTENDILRFPEEDLKWGRIGPHPQQATVYRNFPTLVSLLAVKMRCSSIIGRSQAGVNTTVSSITDKKFHHDLMFKNMIKTYKPQPNVCL